MQPSRHFHLAVDFLGLRRDSSWLQCQRRLKADPLGRLKTDPALDEQATTRGAISLLKRVVACGGCVFQHPYLYGPGW